MILRAQAWRGFRAIAAGAIVWVACTVLVVHPLQGLVPGRRAGGWFSQWLLVSVLPPAIASIPVIAGGWAAGRLGRDQRAPIVITFAVLLNLLLVPRLSWLAINALSHERFLPYLLGHVATMLMTTANTLIGGLWLAGIGRRSGPSGLFERQQQA